MSFVEAQVPGGDDGIGVVVCRTGYTGERGYELIAANDVAVRLWDALMAAGADFGLLPCGLGSRDTLRTEMGYPLHGQDISLDVTPNQARLGWAVGWAKDEFWGRDALLREKEAGPERILRGIVATGRGIPRPHMMVSLTHDLMVGEVTSGTFSPDAQEGCRPGAGLLAGVAGRRGRRRRARPPGDLPDHEAAVRRPVHAGELNTAP